MLIRLVLALAFLIPVHALDAEQDAWASAMALKTAKKTVEAAGSFEAFAEIFPQSKRRTEALVEAGVCWYMTGRDARVLNRSTPRTREEFAKAMTLFGRVLAEQPPSPLAPRAKYMQATVKLFDGQLEDAEAEFSGVIDGYMSDKVYYPKALERRAYVRRQLLDTEGSNGDLARFEKELGLKSAEGQLVSKALADAPVLGKPAPLFAVESWVQGPPAPIESLGGQPVALYFYASWCPTCARELPAVLDVQKRFAAQGVVFVGVVNHGNGQTVAQVQKHMADNKIPFPILMDAGDTTKSYGATTIPYLVLVDRDGRIRWRDTPANLNDRTLEKLIESGLEPAQK